LFYFLVLKNLPQKNLITMSVVIAIHNNKGGVGKSSLTIMLAAVLAYDLNSKVLILDGDSSQTSIQNRRQKEMLEYRQALEMYEDPAQRNLIPPFLSNRIESNLANNIGPNNFYRIETVRPEKIPFIAFDQLDYDFIFIDMGAKLEDEYRQVMAKVDLLLIPFGHLNLELDASIDYVFALADAIRSGQMSSKLTVRPFWNRIKLYTNPLCNQVEAFVQPDLENLNIKFLKSRLFEAVSGFGDRKLVTSYSSPMAALDEKDRMMLVNQGTTREHSKEREYLVRVQGFINEVVGEINTINDIKAGF